jgi:signal transduction histidine kinase
MRDNALVSGVKTGSPKRLVATRRRAVRRKHRGLRPTPRKEARLIEAVAAGIAHEVRNPLNSVQINLRILDEELTAVVPDRASPVYGLLARISGELKRLEDFVSEFLRFARPPQIKPESIPVRALLSDLVSFLSPECAGKGVDMQLDTTRGPATALVDPLQLKQALLNLLLNALQATPRGGRIVLRTGGDAHRLTLSVIDNGEGIADGVKDRVFSAFFSTREDGTGLGLPIVRRIVEEHGGSIRVESRPGRGTTVLVTLPTRPGI